MEACLTPVVLGLLVLAIIALSRLLEHGRRIEKLEQDIYAAQRELADTRRELLYARQAFNGLSARMYDHERALAGGQRAQLAAVPAENVVAKETVPEWTAPTPVDAVALPVAPTPEAEKREPPAIEAIESNAAKPIEPPIAQTPALETIEAPTGAYAPSPAPTPAPAVRPQLGALGTAYAQRGDRPSHGSTQPRKAPFGQPTGLPRDSAAGRPEGPPREIDWEQWIGVRGAAALGAGILVIAALYFFKYSIETGLFSPAARVVTGVFVGIGALVGAEYGRRKDNVVLANWLVGAGIAILYTAFWAAHGLYELIGNGPAFAAMIAVTAVCVTLSVRHESLVIALLGLFGGFITPFALSSGSDHPIGLFGYLLILDTALLFVGRRNRWSLLGGLSLFLTLIYQAAWISERMDPDRLGLGIGVVLMFSALFAIFPAAAREGEEREGDSANERFTQLAAVVAPFFFGLYFSLRSDLGPHLYPVGAMLGVLSIGTCVVAWVRGARWLPLAAAIGSLTVTGGWLLGHEIAPVATEVALIVCGLAAIFHMNFEVSGPRFEDIDEGVSTSGAAAVATFGAMFLVWFLGGEESVSGAMPLRVLLGWAFLSALALRHAFFPGREGLHVVLALTLGIFLPAFHVAHRRGAFFNETTSWLAIVAVTALAFLVVSFARRDDDDGEAWSLRAAALFALLALVDPFSFPTHTSVLVHLGVTLLLGVIALTAAARLESGLWVVGAALGLVLVESVWAIANATGSHAPSITLGLFGLGLTATIVTLWPIAFARRFEEQPWAPARSLPGDVARRPRALADRDLGALSALRVRERSPVAAAAGRALGRRLGRGPMTGEEGGCLESSRVGYLRRVGSGRTLAPIKPLVRRVGQTPRRPCGGVLIRPFLRAALLLFNCFGRRSTLDSQTTSRSASRGVGVEHLDLPFHSLCSATTWSMPISVKSSG